MVDLGCGDWQFSQFINWDGIDYRGYDIVQQVIAHNNARFESLNVKFELLDASTDKLPQADLLIVKDVLQHWSNKTIFDFLPRLKLYRYALITNCVHPNRPVPNEDIADGGFRYLDLRRAPFDLPARAIYSFTDYRPFWLRPFIRPRMRKLVMFIDVVMTRKLSTSFESSASDEDAVRL